MIPGSGSSKPEWDWSDKILALGRETRRAMAACRFPWGIYIQADEVLGDGSAEILRRTVQEVDGDRGVEGLLLKYLHFYGDFSTVATNRRWYQREVRCMRLEPRVRRPALPGRAGVPGRADQPPDPGARHGRRDVSLRLGTAARLDPEEA